MTEQNRYCLPIQKSECEEVIKTIEKFQDRYQFFELWLDLIDDLARDKLESLIDAYPGRLIILFRRPNLDQIRLTQEDREIIINLIADKEIYLDIDIATQEEDLEMVLSLRRPVRTILSYHNYNYTPSDDEIERILAKMDQARASAYKISTFCRNEQDALRLLQWCLTLRKEGKSYIILGMGEFGVITRVFGGIWGNMVNFAPDSLDEVSAPGQLTRAALEQIFEALV